MVAYAVGQRTREIGVRMALGAARTGVYVLILGEAGRLTALGILLGLGGSLAATTMLRTLLFGVRSWDPATLATVAVVLSGSALLASYFPARRAASVNPIEALRAELPICAELPGCRQSGRNGNQGLMKPNKSYRSHCRRLC